MAALRAEIHADNKAEASRLAHHAIRTNTHTWNTEIIASLDANGRGTVRVTRNGETIHTFDIEAEVSK